MPPHKVLPIPCPYCSGTVTGNGTVTCKKCGTYWVSYTREATGLTVGYTESAIYNFAVVVLGAEFKKARAISGTEMTIDSLRTAATHLERASRALKLMITELDKSIGEKSDAR